MKTEKKDAVKQSISEPAQENTVDKGLIVDLDNVAFNIRRILRKAITETLKGAGVNIDQSVFLRHCINGAPEFCVPPLLESLKETKLAANKIIGEIEDSFAGKLKKNLEINTDIKAVISNARKSGFGCAAFTSLRDDPLQAVINKAGEGFFDQFHTCSGLARIGAYSTTWRALAGSLGVRPQHCIAVVGNDIMCKSALASGMRCIVIPDECTAWQDFSGADAVLDGTGELNVQLLNSVMQPYAARISK